MYKCTFKNTFIYTYLKPNITHIIQYIGKSIFGMKRISHGIFLNDSYENFCFFHYIDLDFLDLDKNSSLNRNYFDLVHCIYYVVWLWYII